VDALGSQVQGAGSLGVAVFVAIYAASTLLVFPKGALSIAAGLIYGFWPAFAIVLVAAMLGAVVAFGLGRVLGRDAVERMAGAHLLRLDALIARHGVAAIVLVRLIPLIPFTIVNYASGLTSISFRAYTMGTLIGMLPGTAAYVALGAYGRQPGSWEFIAAGLAFAGLTVAGVAIARRRHTSMPVVTSGGTS